MVPERGPVVPPRCSFSFRIATPWLFNPAFVEKLLSEHENGFADHGSLLWGLLSIELWQRVFMDSQQRPERLTTAFAAQA